MYGNKIVMAGGTVGGAASRSILLFDPATGKVHYGAAYGHRTVHMRDGQIVD